MILSASRRTDIPSFYSEWFMNRIRERYVLTRNPLNPRQISKIDLSPEVIDCIVFWTKNPIPLISKLNELDEYRYYFQFTLNAYGIDVEPGLPRKNNTIINAFISLSNKLGKEKIVWRYDPIFINEKYSISYHVKYFSNLASILHGYTEKCTISFIDFPKRIFKQVSSLGYREPDYNEKLLLAKELSEISKSYNLKIDTCAEAIDLSSFGIEHAKCIDDELIARISNHPLQVKKDSNQRLECGCVLSVDIGAYNTCHNGCRYCYASFNEEALIKNQRLYDPFSPLLCSKLTEEDKVFYRNRNPQNNQLDLPF